MARRASKVDANQSTIVDALRRAGASVQHLHGVADGCPDILIGAIVGGHRVNLLAEIKDGGKPPSRRKLTPPQVAFHAAWRGQVAIIKSVDEALNLVGQVQVRGQIS